MKKLAITLSLLLCASCAYAYVEEGATSNINNLKTGGYTTEMLKAIDTVKVQSQGESGTYEPYFKNAVYGTNPVHKWYQVFQRYLDPAQDDNLFGRHETSFQNGWFEDSPNFVEKPSFWVRWTNKETTARPAEQHVAPDSTKEAL